MKPVSFTLKCTDDDQVYHYDDQQRITFGRSEDNTHRLGGQQISRQHCYLEFQDGRPILFDTSANGVLVDGRRMDKQLELQNGAKLQIGPYNFIFLSDTGSSDEEATLLENFGDYIANHLRKSHPTALNVTVTGGGPVGLSFALLLESLMGDQVAIRVYDGRWTQEGSRIVWRSETQRNARRQQVVTVHSRQYLKLPAEVQNGVFRAGDYSEMWPKGADSIRDCGPRNIRIAHLEDQLLAMANEKPERIQLIPTRFDPKDRRNDIEDQQILAICEGSRSRTREAFIAQFGQAETTMYSVDGDHLQDVVLGLRVKSELPDAMAVLLNVAQNRFLLNSISGGGFLNMRLTDEEVQEVVGIDLNTKEFKDCIQSQPCLMERTDKPGEFGCATHNSLFLPAILKESALWRRVLDGLKLYEIKEENLSAVTVFRLELVQRPRFTAQLYPPTQRSPGTFGCLLGDAANAVHFWSGRGLNGGIASAVSLARCLKYHWRNRTFREADFLRHEALMAMLQYRHKSHAWRSMVATDTNGAPCAIKHKIMRGIVEAEKGKVDKDSDIGELISRLSQIKSRLKQRVSGLPSDAMLREHFNQLNDQTLRVLVASGPWDTFGASGEEVDVDLLFEDPDPQMPPEAIEDTTPERQTTALDTAHA